jgi:hypothetical protein
MFTKLATSFTDEFKKVKANGEAALAQLGDEDLLFRLNEDQNSIAVIIKHLHGNFLSRFTDFLTTDGEKPNRHRDQEFIEQAVSKSQVMQWWNEGWNCLIDSLSQLTDADLLKTITIRNVPHTVIGALNRSLAHSAYHIGQIILLAKHIKGSQWKYITVPRGKSAEFNQKMGMK